MSTYTYLRTLIAQENRIEKEINAKTVAVVRSFRLIGIIFMTTMEIPQKVKIDNYKKYHSLVQLLNAERTNNTRIKVNATTIRFTKELINKRRRDRIPN